MKKLIQKKVPLTLVLRYELNEGEQLPPEGIETILAEVINTGHAYYGTCLVGKPEQTEHIVDDEIASSKKEAGESPAADIQRQTAHEQWRASLLIEQDVFLNQFYHLSEQELASLVSNLLLLQAKVTNGDIVDEITGVPPEGY